LEASSKAVGNAISGLYKKLESQGFSAGEEFAIAIRAGLDLGATIILGDRDVDVTLQHLTAALSKTDLKKLFSATDIEEFEANLPSSVRNKVNGGGELDKEQMTLFVETMKQKQTVVQLMNNLRALAPEVYTAMVGERDEYMANGINQLSTMKRTVAVMGLAHVDGVERYLQDAGWTAVPTQCKIQKLGRIS